MSGVATRAHTGECSFRTGRGQVGEKSRERGGQRDWPGNTLSITLRLLRAQAVFNKEELHAIFKDGHSAVCRNHQLKIPCGDRL